MARAKTRLTQGGRVVIPAEFRRALDIKVGDEVIIELGEGQLTLMTTQHAIRRAQEVVRRYIPEGRGLVDELISERRAEAARE
jgi:AbrB family looped-hinge helix DNA binding protein